MMYSYSNTRRVVFSSSWSKAKQAFVLDDNWQFSNNDMYTYDFVEEPDYEK